jgi:hypothetical protein
MKKLVILVALSALAIPIVAAGQSVFEGTWKIDPSNLKLPEKSDKMMLSGGMFECSTCVPPIKVKADGTDQAISGNPYIGTIAIKVVSDHEIQETDKKDGKVVGTSTTTVSPDGNTLTTTFSDSSNTNGGPPVTGKAEAKLVMKGPAGSHAISGEWQQTSLGSMSDNSFTWTYKVSGDEVTMTAPTGQSYTAKIGGTDVPMKGDPGVTSIAVRMIGSDTLEETNKRDGKVVGVSTFTVAADGKTAKSVYTDKLQDRTYEASAAKQ